MKINMKSLARDCNEYIRLYTCPLAMRTTRGTEKRNTRVSIGKQLTNSGLEDSLDSIKKLAEDYYKIPSR